MDHSLQRQAVGQLGRLVGVTHDNGGERNDTLRKFQYPRNVARRVDRRSQDADTQSVHFGLDAEVLRSQQGVGRSVEEPCEIVVGRIGVALLAPHREAVYIGADSHHAGRLADHRLVEMAWREFLAQRLIAGHHQRIELHVAARRGARSSFEAFMQHLFGNGRRAEFTYRTMLEKHTFHKGIFLNPVVKITQPPAVANFGGYFVTKLAKLLEVLLFLPRIYHLSPG